MAARCDGKPECYLEEDEKNCSTGELRIILGEVHKDEAEFICSYRVSQKNPLHFFSHPISNRNNSKTVCPIYLKNAVRRVPMGDSSHIKFQVIPTNCFRVIAVKNWMRKKV